MPVQHHRDWNHRGTQDDTTVVLSTSIGPYAAGTTLADVLADLYIRLNQASSSESYYGLISANAWIQTYFRANAVKGKAQSGSFTADARYGLASTTLTANAIAKQTTSGTFTASAYVVP